MKNRSCLPLAASIVFAALALPAPADVEMIELNRLELRLKDGSQLKAVAHQDGLRVSPGLADPFDLKWDKINKIDLEKGSRQAVLHFINGDRLTVEIISERLEVRTLLGNLDVPFHSLSSIGVSSFMGERHNVALGKPVHGRDGASHGKGLAQHVTDGDPETHAKPPASSFDYRIDLHAGSGASFHIDEILINWGYFGDYFKGVRQKGGEGWANAAWPGEYVTSYVVECRKKGQQDWQLVHQHEGRPVNEDAPGVIVHKQELNDGGYSSTSVTRITGLDLRHVTELRIRAKGGHWIGLFELQALGNQEPK